jgi:hypothetical protein
VAGRLASPPGDGRLARNSATSSRGLVMRPWPQVAVRSQPSCSTTAEATLRGNTMCNLGLPSIRSRRFSALRSLGMDSCFCAHSAAAKGPLGIRGNSSEIYCSGKRQQKELRRADVCSWN